MSMTVHLDIVSAEEQIYSGLIASVQARGTLGELGILPGHAPLLTSLVPGPVRLTLQDGSVEVMYVSGGFLEVQPSSITILADTVLRAVDIDEAQAIEARSKAAEDLADHQADEQFAAVAARLAAATAQLRILEELRSGLKR